MITSIEIRPAEWTDWRWQQRSAIRSVEQLREIFPRLPEASIEIIRRSARTRRFQLTPYYLTLVERAPDGGAPLPTDPMWRQVMPAGEESAGVYDYDGVTENWEMPSEMVTPIAQHKYPDRIIVRLANVCFAYCQFCYEALRTLEKETTKASFHQAHWAATVEFVRQNPGIHEVILSGGEPLMHSDQQLEQVLSDLRAIDRPLAIRIHTRALTFNPFRVTDELVELLRRHRLNAIGLHVSHPAELTSTFAEGVGRLRRAAPILFANMPLLRHINDDVATIERLTRELYLMGVARGYLYHFMPNSPGGAEFRTSVQAGVDIVRSMKRRVCNLCVPEFVLPHHTGKHTMPLLADGEQPPVKAHDAAGYPVVRYTNWQGELVEYPDVVDA
jgi:lysine 2,3-aminomutase